MTSKEAFSVDILYIARGLDYGIKQVEDFFSSYDLHPLIDCTEKNQQIPKYTLNILAKGWENKEDEYSKLCKIAEKHNAKIIDLPDSGFDLGAYFLAANQLKSDYILCLVSSSIILNDNWLIKFVNAYKNNKKLGLLGACGSWEKTPNPWYFWRDKLKKYSKNSLCETIIKNIKKYKYKIKIKLLFNKNLSLPNYHVRTNAFMIKRSLYIEFIKKYGIPKSKLDCYCLESAYKSLTKFVLNKKMQVGVLGKDGKVYPPEEWKNSKTYTSSDLSNVIIKDKYYDFYVSKNYIDRKIRETFVWGDFVQDIVKIKQIKFSVLLPTKNRLDLLKHALKSVLNQDYDNWEIIVSDNCSEDDVKGYVESLKDSRIIYLRAEKPLTVTENWNQANNMATGDYIIMLGDDEALLPGFFQKCIDILQKANMPEVLTFGAYMYLQPNVAPFAPKGNVSKSIFYFDTENKENNQFYLVSLETRKQLVQKSLDFNYTYAFNMQFFLYSKDFIARAKIYGDFYKPPYPDYYTANIFLLLAKTFVVMPEPMVIIGITNKSYGYYYLNNKEKEGMTFHNDSEYRKLANKKIRKKLCDIDEMSTAALVTFFKVREVDHSLKLNILKYYKKVISRLFEFYDKKTAMKITFKEVLPKASIFYWIKLIVYCLKKSLSRKQFRPAEGLPEISYDNISLLLEDIQKGKFNA